MLSRVRMVESKNVGLWPDMKEYVGCDNANLELD
jgi:hypothetical protein